MRNGMKLYEKEQGFENMEYWAIQALQIAFPLKCVIPSVLSFQQIWKLSHEADNLLAGVGFEHT